MASKAATGSKKTKKAQGPAIGVSRALVAQGAKALTNYFAESIRKAPSRGLLFPAGTMTPNMAGRFLGITGEAVKQWIYRGRLKAAKLGNGYFAIKPEHLAEAICAQGATAEFKPQPNKKYLKRNVKKK